MEWLNQLFAENYLYALGWMLIHALWQIAGIGLLLWLMLKIFSSKSPGFKYRLSFAALLLIPLLGAGTFFFHLETTTQADTDISVTVVSEAMLGQQIQEFGSLQTPILSWRNEIEKHIPSLVNIWSIGVILFMIRLASSLADIRQLHQKKHFPLEEGIKQFGLEKCRQLGIRHAVQILQSTSLDMPITYGILKPVVLIPTSLLLHISPAQLEAIIAHELAHIKRYDYVFNLIQRITEVVYFFHPAFWWINSEIRKYREMACDEIAVSSGIAPTDLAYGLATVLNHAQKQIPEMAMAASKKSTPTLDRIKRIMGIKTDTTQPTTLTSITMILTLLIGATLMVSAEREPQSMEFDQEKAEMASQDLDLIPSDTTKNEKNIITDEGVIIRIDDNGNLAIIDTTKNKRSEKLHLDSLFAEKHQLSPEEWERIQKSFKKQEDWHIPFKDLDFEFKAFSNMPMLKLDEMPRIDFGTPPHIEIDPEVWEKIVPGPEFFENLPKFDWHSDSTQSRYRMPVFPFSMDSTKMDREQLEIFKRELKESTAAIRQEIQAQQMQRKAEQAERIFEMKEKQKEWSEAYKSQMQEWTEQNQPRIEEFKLKMQEWKEANEPQLEAFKKEMEAWQMEHQEELQVLKEQLKEMQLQLKENLNKMKEIED